MKKFTILFALFSICVYPIFGQINTYPYLEDFENGPGGWVANNTINGSWALGNPQAPVINSAASGANAWSTNLSGDYNSNEDSWVESPVFDFSGLSNPQIQLSLWYESELGWDGLVLQSSIDAGLTWQNVGAFGDPNNWYNGVNLGGNPGNQGDGWSGDNGAGTGSWVSASHALSGLAGQSSVILRFAFGSDGIIQNDGVAFDDIAISEVLCSQPINLSATNITATTADLSWTETGSATLWDIEIGPAGFIPTGTPNVQATSNPFTIPPLLSANTSYDYYVRADCGGGNGTSNWSGPFTFTTPCTVFIAPYFDDVEAHATTLSFNVSNCWADLSPGAYDWNIDGNGSTPSSATGPLSANSGLNYFYVEASGSNQSDTAYLESPDIDITPLTAASIEFYYHMYGGVMGNLFIDVFNGVWTQVDSIMGQQQTNQTDPWIKRTVDISSYTGTIKIRFRAASLGSFQGDISLDDIRVKELPTCFDPSNLGASNITANSADLTWVENGLAVVWDIEHGPSGFVPSGVPTISGTTNSPYNLGGLLPTTAYDFYVRSDCGLINGTSNWSGPYAFTTLCTPIITPWVDSVEFHTPTTTLTLSNCWEATASGIYDWNIDGNGSTPSSGTGPLGANSGTNYFYVEASGGSQGDTAQLTSPTLDISNLNAAGLEFYYHMFGVNMGDLYVDVFDGTNWINNVDSILGQQQTNQSDPWLSKTVDLSNFTGSIRVRFRAIKAGTISGDISLDDIAIVETITCAEPDSLTLNLIGNTTVEVSWIETGTATLWEIEFDTTGFTLGTGSAVVTGSNPHQLGGLVANKTYDFYVRSICAQADSSTWLGPISISTTNVGVEVHDQKSGFMLYPNPSDGVFNVFIEEQNEILNMRIVDVTGREIWTSKFLDQRGPRNYQIDLSKAPKGIYFFILTTDKDTRATQFIVR